MAANIPANQGDIDKKKASDLKNAQPSVPSAVFSRDADDHQRDADAAKKAEADKDKPKEQKPQISQLVVLVDGAAGVSTPTTIFEYELPVLEAIHGEEMVHVHSEKDVDVPEGLTAAQAYQQLLTKYPSASHNDIKGVYPTAKALSRTSGLPYNAGDNKAGKYNQAIVRDHSENRNSDASLTGADLNDPHANQGDQGNLPVSQAAKDAAEQQRLSDQAQRSQDADRLSDKEV